MPTQVKSNTLRDIPMRGDFRQSKTCGYENGGNYSAEFL
jgi:hypothetical protein